MTGATRVAIIGLGAIGGSAALRLVERGARPRGYSSDGADMAAAAAAGIDATSSIAAAVADADLVLLAVPLDAMAAVAAAVLDAAPPTATILHAAGLQRAEALGLDHPQQGRMIGTHPLAGTERGGFAAARSDLFAQATVYVEPRAGARQRADAELFWSMCGARRIEYQDAESHDAVIGAVSHLPQLLATALAGVYAELEMPASRLGPGGRDMTRLAASSLSMWRPLLERTPESTVRALDRVIGRLGDLRDAVAGTGAVSLDDLWTPARRWRSEEREEQR